MCQLIAGAKGMLGQDLTARVVKDDYDLIATDIDGIDITDSVSVREVVKDVDVVVNAAAFIAVDAAEEKEAAAFTVNVTGPEILARRCREIGVRFVHIPTNYISSSDAAPPYREDGPLELKGAYGRMKAVGEWAVRCNTNDYLIVRTTWLYGAGGKCFPKTMHDLSQTHKTLSVVTDEVSRPTWTVDLVDLIVRLVDAEAPTGIYHGTSSSKTNWHGFTCEIVASIGRGPDMVKEATAATFKHPAPRPHYSVLEHNVPECTGVEPIGDWKERWLAAKDVVLG